MKGTDQSFSLEPQGLSKLIRNLNRIPKLLGNKDKKFLKSEKNLFTKWQKKLQAIFAQRKKIVFNDLSFKSPGDGLRPYEYKNNR